jgi:Zn-dependent protease with chaperone function
MTAAAGPAGTSPRPNPFAFPSQTTFRFALVVGAVLGATLYVWDWLWIVVGSDRDAVVDGALACLALASTDFPLTGDPTAFGLANDAFRECTQTLYRESSWWMLGGAALVLALGGVLALAWPALKERRQRLEPLREDEAPEVLRTLRALASEAGLRREPQWTWNPLATAPTGQAYGRPGRHAVALSGGLVVLHATDPDAFRAIVRHELAHLLNGDVDVTYATLSLWYAFLAAAVLPFLLVSLGDGELFAGATWRVLALAALVYLTRNAVLRSRELYADVRASVPDGPDGALRRVLGALPRSSRRLRDRILALHPTAELRLATVDDPRPLFGLRPLELFAAGLTATIAFDSVRLLVASFVKDPLDASILAALVFAPLVVGVAGVAIWRSRFAALACRERAKPTWPGALALTAGLLLGPELALERIAGAPDATLLDDLGGRGVIWIVALAALLVLALDWVAVGASLWLRANAARRSRGATAAGLLISAGVFTVVLGTYFALRELRVPIELSKASTALQHAQVDSVAWAGPRWLWQLVMDPLTLVVLSKPVVPLALVAVWAFPLAAALVRNHRTGEAPWAFLDPGGRLEPTRPRLRPVRALAIGAAGGLACLLAYVALRGGIHAGVSWDTRQRDELILAFVFWQLVIALAFQAAAAGVAVAVARNAGRLAEGLAAACVTGTIATFGLVAGPVAGGCVDPIGIRPGPCTWDVSADFTWTIWRQVVVEGAVAALAAGLAVLAALTLVRAWERRPGDAAPARVSGA